MLHLTIALLWCWANRIADQTPICYLVFLMCKRNTEACCSAFFKRSVHFERDLKIKLERKREKKTQKTKTPTRNPPVSEKVWAQICCLTWIYRGATMLHCVSFCWQRTYTSALFSFPQRFLHHVFFCFFFGGGEWLLRRVQNRWIWKAAAH